MKTKFLTLLILFGSFLMVAQDATLNGSVSDASTDGPLPGVSVFINGTQTGTSTDFNGNFSLNGVSSGDVIQFSYIGYLTQEVTIESSFNISISLSAFNSGTLDSKLPLPICSDAVIKLFIDIKNLEENLIAEPKIIRHSNLK